MKPSDVAAALAALLPTRRPVYLWGPPGVGKSSIIRQAAASLQLEVCDVRAVLLDPVDLRGLPAINGDCRAHWCPPAFLPHDPASRGVLFLDELAQASPLVQAACLQLTLDRRVGEYVLPDGWTVVAASNRQEDRAGAHRLITPLLNRFVHVDLEVAHDDWHAWAVAMGIMPEVRSFLRFRPALLFAFDPASGARSFPTPRSWEFVSQVLTSTPADLLYPVVAGCVGDGPAVEFVAFSRLYRDLPDVDQVLQQPQTVRIPSDPAVLYALAGALAEKSRDGQHTDAIATVAGRMPAEFGTLVITDMVAANTTRTNGKATTDPRVLSNSKVTQWITANRDLLRSR